MPGCKGFGPDIAPNLQQSAQQILPSTDRLDDVYLVLGPADDAAAEGVQDEREEHQPLPTPDVRQVSDP